MVNDSLYRLISLPEAGGKLYNGPFSTLDEAERYKKIYVDKVSKETWIEKAIWEKCEDLLD